MTSLQHIPPDASPDRIAELLREDGALIIDSALSAEKLLQLKELINIQTTILIGSGNDCDKTVEALLSYSTQKVQAPKSVWGGQLWTLDFGHWTPELARVAQLTERWSYKPEVEGLNPSLGTRCKDEGGRMKDEEDRETG